MKIKNFLVAGAMLFGTAVATTAVSTPAWAVDCPKGSVNDTAETLGACNIKEDDSLMKTINTIIDVILGVLGLVAVVMIVLGGVQYTTSAGDPNKVKKAKDTILYGIVGLIIALLAFAIVNFVLSSALSSSAATTSPATT